jgi:hypothetical protein
VDPEERTALHLGVGSEVRADRRQSRSKVGDESEGRFLNVLDIAVPVVLEPCPIVVDFQFSEELEEGSSEVGGHVVTLLLASYANVRSEAVRGPPVAGPRGDRLSKGNSILVDRERSSSLTEVGPGLDLDQPAV